MSPRTATVLRVALCALLLVWGAVTVFLSGTSIGPDTTQVAATLASPWLWVMAFVLGAMLRGPATYAAFVITAKLGADGYMLAMAAMPPLAMGLEMIAASFGLVPAPKNALADLGVAGIVIAGGIWVVVAQVRTRRR